MDNGFHHGRQGCSLCCTDQTISTFVMLKGMFSLSLQATQGLFDSLPELMNVLPCPPDNSCVSKLARTVKVAYRLHVKGAHHRPGYRLDRPESVE